MYFVRARQSHGISMDSIIAFFFFCHKVLLFPLLSVCFRDEFEVWNFDTAQKVKLCQFQVLSGVAGTAVNWDW